jgi:hypothetical protein
MIEQFCMHKFMYIRERGAAIPAMCMRDEQKTTHVLEGGNTICSYMLQHIHKERVAATQRAQEKAAAPQEDSNVGAC